MLGENPWKKQRAAKKEGKDFYKGAFDSIPFLNDDAKRTFVHLLLRPGYMIRDYVGGKHDRYLTPLAALIIFYAFFTLISSSLILTSIRKRWIRAPRPSWSAAAAATAATAYALCQVSFFMLFALILSGGKDDSVGYYIQAIILVVDYKQWLSLTWRKSIGRTIKTSIYYGLVWLLFWVLLAMVIVSIALATGVVSLDQLLL